MALNLGSDELTSKLDGDAVLNACTKTSWKPNRMFQYLPRHRAGLSLCRWYSRAKKVCTEKNCFPYTRMSRLKPAAPLAGKWGFQGGFPYTRELADTKNLMIEAANLPLAVLGPPS